MHRFGPASSHTAYRENNPPRYLHEPLDRPVSAQAHYGQQYAYAPQYAPVTRPVIEQKVYTERITPQAPPPPPPLPSAPRQQHHHSAYPSSAPSKQENHDLRVKVADLQMRIDRLLKGRDDVEAEGSATITMWDELLTQICDLYAITVNKVEIEAYPVGEYTWVLIVESSSPRQVATLSLFIVYVSLFHSHKLPTQIKQFIELT